MIWVVIILIAFATLLNAFLIHQINDKVDSKGDESQAHIGETRAVIQSFSRRLEDTTARLNDTINMANQNDIRLNNMATRNKLDIARANKQIDDIIIKLQEITADIHRLDHDEKEIRSYYCNYREPRFDNAGVEWAEEYVTHDD